MSGEQKFSVPVPSWLGSGAPADPELEPIFTALVLALPGTGTRRRR